MKFINFNKSAILLFVAIVIISGISSAAPYSNPSTNAKIPNDLIEKLSNGKLSQKEVSDIYKKNYSPELEYHQIFTSCLDQIHKKESNFSIWNKIFGSGKNMLEIKDLGIKVNCEIYLNKIFSSEYKERKNSEENPLNKKLKELKSQIQNLKERHENLKTHSLIQRTENKMKMKKAEIQNEVNYSNSAYASNENENKVEAENKEENQTENKLDSENQNQSESKVNGTKTSSRTTSRGSKSVSISSSSSSSSSSGSMSLSSSSSTFSSNIPIYNLSEGNMDTSSFNSMVSSLKSQIKQCNERFTKLEGRYQKAMQELNHMKFDSKSDSDKKCECDSKLKNCEMSLIQKDTKITELTNTIIQLKTKITILQANPPKGKCDDLQEEIKKQIEANKKCEQEKTEITNKFTTVNNNLSVITKKYESLEVKVQVCKKEEEECQNKIITLQKRINYDNSRCEQRINSQNILITNLKQEIHNLRMQINKLNLKINLQGDGGKGDNGNNGGKDKTEILIKQKYEDCMAKVNELEIIIKKKDIKITQLTIQLSNRDKDIVELKSQITKLQLEISNIKISYEKRIRELDIIIKEGENKIRVCKEEKDTLIIYKTKYEKCSQNDGKDINKLNLLIQNLKIQVENLTNQLKECKNNITKKDSECQKNITIKNKYQLELNQCLEKKKFLENQINIKVTEITTIIQKNKEEIILIQKNLNKKCDDEKNILQIQITSLKKEVDSCKKNQDCQNTIKKYEVNINQYKITIENNKKSIDDLVKKLNKCESDKTEEKKNVINLKNEVNSLTVKLNICNDELKKTNPRKCDDSKYNKLIIEYNKLYRTWLGVSATLHDCQREKNELNIEINELKKKQCDGKCEGNLKICKTELTNIKNTYETNIQIKVNEINSLTIKIGEMEKKCKNDNIDTILKLKTCESKKIVIANKYEICKFDLKNEIHIKNTYYKELIFMRKEFKNCSKQNQCKENEIKLHQRIADKCEQSKTALERHLESLKERFAKLHNEKVSSLTENNNQLKNVSKQCKIDVDQLMKFLSSFDLSVTELTNLKENIIVELKKDEIDKNKNDGIIGLKNEEIKRGKDSINKSKAEIEQLKKVINELIIKLNSSTDINAVKSIIQQLEENQKNLKNKNESLIILIEQLSKSETELKILQLNLQNNITFKSFVDSKHKDVSNIYSNMQKILEEIRKYIEIKKNNSNKTDKIKEKPPVMPTNPLVSILKGEKEVVENNNKKNEEKIKLLEKKLFDLKKMLAECNDKNKDNSDVDNTIKNGNMLSVLKDKEFVLNNCGRLYDFKTKLGEICKKKNFGEDDNNTKPKLNKRKNKDIESKGNFTKNNKNGSKDIESKGKTTKINNKGSNDIESKGTFTKTNNKGSKDIESKNKFGKNEKNGSNDIESKGTFTKMNNKGSKDTESKNKYGKNNKNGSNDMESKNNVDSSGSDIESNEKLEFEAKTKI